MKSVSEKEVEDIFLLLYRKLQVNRSEIARMLRWVYGADSRKENASSTIRISSVIGAEQTETRKWIRKERRSF